MAAWSQGHLRDYQLSEPNAGRHDVVCFLDARRLGPEQSV